MKNEKDLQMKILEQIMNEMDEYEFDRKLKPKVMSIKVEKLGKDELPSSLKEMIGGSKEESEEMPEEMEEEMPSKKSVDDDEEEDEENDLDSRFARLMAKKK